MKLFKNLKSGDKIDIFEYDLDSGEIEHHVSTISVLTFGSFSGDNDRGVYFKEVDEDEIQVSSDSSFTIRSTGKSSFKAYFTDIESIELFIKNKINESYSRMSPDSGIKLRENLEKIYDRLWDSELNPTKHKDCSLKGSVKNNDTSDFGVGDILFNPYMEESYLFDGKNILFASDGYSIDFDVYYCFNIRKATEEERKIFLSECRERILKNDGVSEVLIHILSNCGYKWDISIKDIIHEN
jgi:hypothetical protein